MTKQENIKFANFKRKFFKLKLASNPVKASNLGGSCVDLTFSGKIRVPIAPSTGFAGIGVLSKATIETQNVILAELQTLFCNGQKKRRPCLWNSKQC